jgi:hypothetical protein
MREQAGATLPEYGPELVARAETWRTFLSVRRQDYGDPGESGPFVACVRCGACDGVIYDSQGVIGHMVQDHGFRMDGRQWDNSNAEVSQW